MGLKKLLGLAASAALFCASLAHAQNNVRSAYSYVREVTGQVTVVSEANGSVEARRNLPITAGDTLSTEDPARAEVSMADGNVLQIGGGTEVRFVSLSGQQGSDDQVTAVGLSAGSIILSAVGDDDQSVPRIDTDDATVYASLGSRVRVNADPRRGTSVIVRSGSVEVRARTGSYTVRSGNYLTVNGDEEPDIARGDFSRDRFDAWAAERLEVASGATRSESGRYVGEDYAGDVQAMDDYGDWDYNATYDTNVWRPNVQAGWSPYSNGSWYYTPVGLSWWSSDPWGWYPFHYGNWFFDAGWNSWCWSPGYVYSPAWVYWGYSGSYLGWCPVGWYGGYSPWWDSYYKSSSYPRADCFALNGNFATRNVALRGWNFTNGNNVGARGQVEVVNGARMGNRLGSDLAISSRPIVVPARGGNVREALREQIREAPRTIERTSGRDSQRLAPVVAREAKLPATSVDALRERAVVAQRGRLSGPGAPDIAPRGAMSVDRGDASRGTTLRRDSGRTVITNRDSQASPERGRPGTAPDRGGRPEVSRPQPHSQTSDTWRGRAQAPGSSQPDSGRATRAPEAREAKPTNQERADTWRNQTRSTSPREESVQRGGQSWRSRSEVPPARRVIEGAVPSRRAPESPKGSESWRESPHREVAPREAAPRSRDSAPPRRDSAPPPSRDSAPRERPQSPPAYRSAPPPRDSAPRSAPPPRDSAPRQAPPAYRSAPEPRDYSPRQAPAPAPRSMERAPAPSRPAPQFSAPSRPAPQSSAPRSAPAPNHGRPGRS